MITEDPLEKYDYKHKEMNLKKNYKTHNVYFAYSNIKQTSLPNLYTITIYTYINVDMYATFKNYIFSEQGYRI